MFQGLEYGDVDPRLSTKSFKYLFLYERLKYSKDLKDAVKSNAQLKTELPYVANGYSTRIKSFRRIGRIAQAVEDNKLWAAVIDSGGHGIGIGTSQALRPEPNILKDKEGRAVEISYWHEHTVNPGSAFEIGTFVVTNLINQSNILDSSLNAAWMVTLPEDTVKAAVCERIGMVQAHDHLKRDFMFDIGDGVMVPRNLWVFSY